MFDKKVLEKDKLLQKKWQEALSGRKQYKDLDLNLKTHSGLPLKPIYTAGDIEEINYEDIGMAGEFPYTRGLYPLQYQATQWMNQMVHGYGLPEHTRERMDFLAKEGAQGYFGQQTFNLAFDPPSKMGFDPDAPEAKGRVGWCGVSCCTVSDMDIMFHDFPLDKTRFVLICFEPTMAFLAMYIVHAERRGVPVNKLLGNTVNGLYLHHTQGGIAFPPKYALKLMVEHIKYCSQNMPYWNTTNLCAYDISEAGANSFQEIGLTLCSHIGITEACIEAGLAPDEFIPRFSFQIASTIDFFETIAKYRALRRMWAMINRDRFGCKNPKSLQARYHTHTSGTSLTAQQPLNNAVRVAFEALAAVLGGTHSMATCSYDEALGIPTEEAAQLSLRTQQLVLEETNVTAVSDPLAGSYYMEHLTNKIEQEAYKLIDEMDKQGGFVKAWENGWFRAVVDNEAYQWREKINRGEKTLIGVNKYVTEGEQVNVPVFEYDMDVEKVAIERVREFRRKRDNAKTEAALDSLRQTAEQVKNGNGDLMPAIIDAFRGDATLGETMEVLRQVFDYGWWD